MEGLSDTHDRDEELARLRREVALARFYLDRFADPDSFVWKVAEKAPHAFAREALSELDAERARSEPIGAAFEAEFPVGTARIARLAGGRAGFVEFHQVLARQALDVGQVGAARAALRVLRTSDFSAETHIAEALLAVLRDSRSSEEEMAEAVLRLTSMTPTPGRGQ